MSFHGIRAPRSASTPTSSGQRAAGEARPSDAAARERRALKVAAVEDDVGERRAREVRLLEPAVAKHDPLELRLTESGEVGSAVGEDDVVPGRFGKLDTGQAAEVEFDAAQRGPNGARVREVAVLETCVDRVVERLGWVDVGIESGG